MSQERLSEAVQQHARDVLSILLQQEWTTITLIQTEEGILAFRFVCTDHQYADLECYPTGEMIAVTSRRDADPHVWEVSQDLPLDETLDRILTFVRSGHHTA